MKAARCALFAVLSVLCLPVYAEDLLQIYELALENDPQLKEAHANLLAVGETDDQSIARLLPTLSASAGSSFNRLDNKKLTFQGIGVQEYWNNTASLNLSQPVFHWDYWVQLSQADNQIAQAEAQYQAEQQNLMFRVTQAYFNVLDARDKLEFTRAEKEAIAKQLEQADERFKVGLNAITDVDEARAAFDQAKADEILAVNDLDGSKEKLREIIGDYENELKELGKELPLETPQPANIDTWSKIADTQNFTVIAAINQSEIARKTIEVQRSGHYPYLDLVGNVTKTDNNASFGLRGDQENIGLQLNMPLFAGGAVNSRVRQAEYLFVQAKEKLIQTRRAVNRELKDAYRALMNSISAVEAYNTALISATSALEATSAGFEVGTRNMVDLLRVQSNLYSSKYNYSRAKYAYVVSRIKLKQSAGALAKEDIEAINSLLQK